MFDRGGWLIGGSNAQVEFMGCIFFKGAHRIESAANVYTLAIESDSNTGEIER